MDIKDYILSGAVESYVLGLSSADERVEFEQLCRQYPDLVAARNSFELSLEKQAFENASTPPASVKKDFMNFINQQSGAAQTSNVIPIEKYSAQKSSVARWLAAASVILLVVSGYLAYKYYSETVSLKSELENTKVAQAKLDDRLRTLEEQASIIKDPRVSVVNLTGMPKAPESSASIYWDSTSSNVWLLVKNLPKLPSDKQFQLWAFIDGKPKDLGLFDAQGEDKVMLKMNNTQRAEAFAITIEKRGNGSTPAGDLTTMGKTKL